VGLWLVDVGIAIALVATSVTMFRVGWRRAHRDDAVVSQVTAVQAATLGLLALMLGFTLAIAESRFAVRRTALVEEANAVGTTYLRADFLPEPARTQSRELLRRYVVERRVYFAARPDDVPATTARAQTIHGELWALAAAVAREHPDWDVLTSYVESLNEVIDLEASRDLAIAMRLPATVFPLLVLVAVVAVGVTGYACGLARARSYLALYVVPVLIGLACAVVADLDRSRAGFISTTDRPMARLQHTLGISAEGVAGRP
jgi:hypothetical protein